ncbi:MarR family transcriptional regulator [Salinarchaeum laminariae]|uniref:MarR family transcriptional regulator n=1 Tax=Salinarchaeum laminariae TaxID=869888 RepID=UPI0020BD9109|nr:MarR family transcriptional regulator [Salinarchaeum laminariae]
MSQGTQRSTIDDRGPTGWLVLARHESVATIVDALLDHPPHAQFTQTELADAAEVSRQSVHRHLDLLLDLGVLEPVEGTSPRRYRFDPESDVSEAIVRLDGAVNAAGPGPDAD